MADSFHGEVPGPIWPDEDSHSPWTDFQGPRHQGGENVSPAAGISVIDLNRYSHTSGERSALQQHLDRYGSNPSLEQLWALMDQAWERYGCTQDSIDLEGLSNFYRDPVWLPNGMFIEEDDVSIAHRNAITAAVAAFAPERVVDFGGGFGTLARFIAGALPLAEVCICEHTRLDMALKAANLSPISVSSKNLSAKPLMCL